MAPTNASETFNEGRHFVFLTDRIRMTAHLFNAKPLCNYFNTNGDGSNAPSGYLFCYCPW